MAFGRTTNSLYLLTSAVELMNDARRCRMQDKTLDMHSSQALKHDVDIPDNVGASQAVRGGTLQTGCAVHCDCCTF